MADNNNTSLAQLTSFLNKYSEVKKIWGSSGATSEEFEKNKILFIEEDLKYLGKMFE